MFPLRAREQELLMTVQVMYSIGDENEDYPE